MAIFSVLTMDRAIKIDKVMKNMAAKLQRPDVAKLRVAPFRMDARRPAEIPGVIEMKTRAILPCNLRF